MERGICSRARYTKEVTPTEKAIGIPAAIKTIRIANIKNIIDFSPL